MKVRLTIIWRSIQRRSAHGLFPSVKEAKAHARIMEQRHLHNVRSARIEDPKTGRLLEELSLGSSPKRLER